MPKKQKISNKDEIAATKPARTMEAHESIRWKNGASPRKFRALKNNPKRPIKFGYIPKVLPFENIDSVGQNPQSASVLDPSLAAEIDWQAPSVRGLSREQIDKKFPPPLQAGCVMLPVHVRKSLKAPPFAYVPAAKAEEIRPYRLYARADRYDRIFAWVNGVEVRLSHLVASVPSKGYCVDHHNHRQYDNSDSNLRTITVAENSRNTTGAVSEEYAGIWRARYKTAGKYRELGKYSTERAGRMAVDYYLLRVLKPTPMPYLNFPEYTQFYLDDPEYTSFPEKTKKEYLHLSAIPVGQATKWQVQVPLPAYLHIFNNQVSKRFDRLEDALFWRDEQIIRFNLRKELHQPERHEPYKIKPIVKINEFSTVPNNLDLCTFCVNGNTDFETGVQAHFQVIVPASWQDRLKYKTWVLDKAGYVVHKKSGDRQVLIHRLLMDVLGPEFEHLHVDHIDHNPLNNALENLRVVTPQQNSHNTTPHPTTGFYHVCLYGPKFQAYLVVNQKKWSFYHYDKELCARWYDLAVMLLLPESFHNLNFADWKTDHALVDRMLEIFFHLESPLFVQLVQTAENGKRQFQQYLKK
jgi:hypothetical protein